MRWALIALLVSGFAGSVSAQYISPGLSSSGRLSVSGIPPEEDFEKRIEEARWQFGPLHVDPWLGLKDVSLVTDQTDADGGTTSSDNDDTDLTATAGAGLRAYGGNNVVWTAHVLPEYVWWQDQDDKGGLAGRLGAGVFGYLNRVRFELSWRRTDSQQYFNAELPVLTLLETTKARAALEVEVIRGGFLFAYAERDDRAGDADDAVAFTALDRNEDRLVAGIGLRGRNGFEAGVAIEDSTTDFDDQARSLSSEGEAIHLFFGLDRERLKAKLDVARREVTPVIGSVIQPFEETTGILDIDWRLGRSINLRGFGQRTVDYALASDVSHIVSDRLGAEVRWRPGRSIVSLVAATGEDDYEPLAGSRRLDDVTELQASFQVPIGDALRLGFRWSQIDYDSNIQSFDRDVTAYGLNLELGPLLERLNIGSAEGAW